MYMHTHKHTNTHTIQTHLFQESNGLRKKMLIGVKDRDNTTYDLLCLILRVARHNQRVLGGGVKKERMKTSNEELLHNVYAPEPSLHRCTLPPHYCTLPLYYCTLPPYYCILLHTTCILKCLTTMSSVSMR